MDIQARRQLPGSCLPMIDQENDPGSGTEEFLKFVGYPDQYRKTNTPPPTSDLSRQQTEEQQKNTEIKTEYCIMVNSSSDKNFISLSHNNPDHQIVTVDKKQFYDTTKLEQPTQPQQSIPQNFLTDDNHSIVSDQKYSSSSESYNASDEYSTDSSDETESPMSSDDEYSTPSYRKFDDQETLISEQPPRKKRRVNTRAVPDDTDFTITCINCSDRPLFYARVKSNLIDNFKRQHLNRKHQKMTCEQIKTYIKNHLKEAKQIEIFSVDCPILKCEHTGRTYRKFNLKNILFQHVYNTKKHQNEKKNYSKESLAEYIKETCTSESVLNCDFFYKVRSKKLVTCNIKYASVSDLIDS